MTETLAPASPARSYVSRLRAALLASLVLGLSLSLVVVSGGHDRAAALTTAKPITLGGAAKAAPLRLISMTSPIGLAINGLAIGMILYNERDSWWPVVKGLLNPEGGRNDQGTAGTLGITGVTGVSDPTNGATFGGTAAISNVTNTASTYTFHVKNRNCKKPDGSTYIAAPQINIGQMTGPTGAGNKTFLWGFPATKLLCTNGDLLQAAEIGMSGGTTNTPATMVWTRPVTDTEYFQTSTVRCKNLTTGALNTISVTNQGEPDKLVVPSCEAKYPGSIPWDLNVKGGPSGATKDVLNVTHDQTIWDTNEYGDCYHATKGLVCFVEIQIDGVPCLIGQGNCPNWKEMHRRHPDRVKCMFGTHELPITDCDYLRYAYQKTKTVTTVGTDGEPDLNPEVSTNPNPNPSPSPSPTPNPTPSPTPTPAPTAGPNPTAPPTVSVETDPDSQGCYGEAWGWNPVDWVLVPVKCALKWAFVPKTSLQTRVETINTGITTKVPFSWFAGFATVPAAVGGGGCPDWVVTIPGTSTSENVVCNSSFTDAIRAARPVLLVFMGSLALWPLIRSTAYAAFPIIKPQPGVLR